MHVLILYGTTQGQARKIAEYVEDRLLAGGQVVTLVDAAGLPPDYRIGDVQCDLLMVVDSLHLGHFHAVVEHVLRENAGDVAGLPSAFVAVSLGILGDGHDRSGLDECVARFQQNTGWSPGIVEHAAGAIRFTQYDFLTRWAMKFIAGLKGVPTRMGQDYEFTNWSKLASFCDRLTEAKQCQNRREKHRP